MLHIFRHTLLLFMVVLSACQSSTPQQSEARQKDEAKAVTILAKARTALYQKRYNDAKKNLRSLRSTCPLALNGRENGILLMDSIEIASTADRLRVADSLVQDEMQRRGSVNAQTQAHFDELCQQAKFYHRKLQHDKDQRKNHD